MVILNRTHSWTWNKNQIAIGDPNRHSLSGLKGFEPFHFNLSPSFKTPQSQLANLCFSLKENYTAVHIRPPKPFIYLIQPNDR